MGLFDSLVRQKKKKNDAKNEAKGSLKQNNGQTSGNGKKQHVKNIPSVSTEGEDVYVPSPGAGNSDDENPTKANCKNHLIYASTLSSVFF